MASGALAHSEADIAVSVTGVAGPGGGSAEKPVGLVHFAAARQGQPVLHVERRFGDLGRSRIRLESVRAALDLVTAAVRLD
jgi:nicotinamide-nucleotide amidase